MSLLDRLRARLVSGGRSEPPSSGLAEAERLLRSGASQLEIRRAASESEAHNPVEAAWKSLLLGDLDSALDSAYAAADERPYDVDSRIVHGMTRLARHELDHAEHEFDAVIEEFGADSDAADGRRATFLARGFAPLDELPADEREWRSAAILLTTLWRLAGLADQRLRTLEEAHPDGLYVIMGALAQGRAADSEADDGAV